jgi:hypothetical protein
MESQKKPSSLFKFLSMEGQESSKDIWIKDLGKLKNSA